MKLTKFQYEALKTSAIEAGLLSMLKGSFTLTPEQAEILTWEFQRIHDAMHADKSLQAEKQKGSLRNGIEKIQRSVGSTWLDWLKSHNLYNRIRVLREAK